MKKIFLLLLFITGVITAQNKEYKHSLSGIKKVRLETNTTAKITVGATNSLILKNYKFSHNDCDNCDHDDDHDHDNVHWSVKNDRDKRTKTKEDKRKGLTAIYPGGKDNTNGFGFSVEKEGTVLIIRDLKSHFQRHGIQLELPKSMNISVDSGNLGSIELEGFTSEVEANTNVGRITMKDVTGPITAHSSVGPINIEFSKVSQSSPITVSTSVSEIDVAIPSSTKANLELKTNGTVYTNFDIEIPTKKGMKNVSGAKKITSAINSGGVNIKLKSSMGNIYLRKK
ncbi:hypothetical protein H3Z83_11465 [Tenacibaculum sp. S7007]|uniref:Adhesin domain-containing protein n=1 Tax=Tenacibaculum pelagium TaxID=2759527 RepID=A0A839AU45_9FLAO|nr:hypothetical protein [Tenacibaculum pelagium]MBA6157131.1 hypothetical protein [Tenacibaculum pelagium]